MYRDLKPENVLLDENGDIKLADFGIARQLETLPDKDTDSESSQHAKQVSRTYTVIGTAQYMPPEVFHKTRGYDFSYDLWSLGCCLYEMVAGVPPFAAPVNAMSDELKYRIQGEQVRIPDYFGRDFEKLMKGLLERNVARRWTLDQVKASAFFKKTDW